MGCVGCVPAKLMVSVLQVVSQKVGGAAANQLQDTIRVPLTSKDIKNRRGLIVFVLSNLNPLNDYLRWP